MLLVTLINTLNYWVFILFYELRQKKEEEEKKRKKKKKKKSLLNNVQSTAIKNIFKKSQNWHTTLNTS